MAPLSSNIFSISSCPYLEHTVEESLGSLPFSPDGQLQRRHVLVVDLVDVRPPLQQDLDNLLPAAADSIVEWCGVPGMEPSSFLTNIHTESWGYLG